MQPSISVRFCSHPALLMRQNSKGLSHSHSTHPGGRQRRSRKRFTAAAQCKKPVDVLPPSFFLLLHLLLFSILLSFPHVVRRLFKMQVTSACVCVRVCAWKVSQPCWRHILTSAAPQHWLLLAFGTPPLHRVLVAMCLVRALALGFGAFAASAAAAIAACKFLK